MSPEGFLLVWFGVAVLLCLLLGAAGYDPEDQDNTGYYAAVLFWPIVLFLAVGSSPVLAVFAVGYFGYNVINRDS